MPLAVDVLCVGHAAYDLVFAVDRHPGPDEKLTANALHASGGGPAANAAVAAARLGSRAAFAGYLGTDEYGQRHYAEFEQAGVVTGGIVRGAMPTPLSVIIVKPDGRRSVVNHRCRTARVAASAVDPLAFEAGVLLFDGHEPELARIYCDRARSRKTHTVLDAGSVHAGSCRLAGMVDNLVASRRFAHEYTGEPDPERAVLRLLDTAPRAVITLGDEGLVWATGAQCGRLPAFPVEVRDTTGAGDAFHGAFAAGLARGLAWEELLRFASAVAALCCTGYGGRQALPTGEQVRAFLARQVPEQAG